MFFRKNKIYKALKKLENDDNLKKELKNVEKIILNSYYISIN